MKIQTRKVDIHKRVVVLDRQRNLIIQMKNVSHFFGFINYTQCAERILNRMGTAMKDSFTE